MEVFCQRAYKQHKRSPLWPSNTKQDLIRARVVTIKSPGRIIRIDPNNTITNIGQAQVATSPPSMKTMTWTPNGTISIQKRQPVTSLEERSQMKSN